MREAIRKVVDAIAPKDPFAEKRRQMDDACKRIDAAVERMNRPPKEKATK